MLVTHQMRGADATVAVSTAIPNYPGADPTHVQDPCMTAFGLRDRIEYRRTNASAEELAKLEALAVAAEAKCDPCKLADVVSAYLKSNESRNWDAKQLQWTKAYQQQMQDKCGGADTLLWILGGFSLAGIVFLLAYKKKG